MNNSAPQYRSWLQSIVDGGNTVTGGAQGVSRSQYELTPTQASALLGVVGDDAVINQEFMADPYKYTGNDRGQVFSTNNPSGQNWGIGPQSAEALNRQAMSLYETQFGKTLGQNTGTGGWTSQNQALYDQSVAELNRQLGRADTQRDIALGNVGSQYNQKYQGLQSGRKQAQSDFDFNSTTNRQNYLTDENRINSQGAQGLRGLLRQLGAMGAGGGSAYQYSAPEAVGNFVREQMTGAGQGFAQNAQNLDRSLTTFNNQADAQEKQLGDWRKQQENQVRSTAEQNKVSLLDTLRQLAATRAQSMGSNIQAALDPFTNQIRQAETSIDQLGRFNPQFSGAIPTYSAPELSRFQASQTPGAQITPMGQTGQTPYLNLLLGRDEERRLR